MDLQVSVQMPKCMVLKYGIVIAVILVQSKYKIFIEKFKHILTKW